MKVFSEKHLEDAVVRLYGRKIRQYFVHDFSLHFVDDTEEVGKENEVYFGDLTIVNIRTSEFLSPLLRLHLAKTFDEAYGDLNLRYDFRNISMNYSNNESDNYYLPDQIFQKMRAGGSFANTHIRFLGYKFELI